MLHLLYSPAAGAALATVLVLSYAIYRAALPRTLPGIPYHKDSATRIGGDAWGMIKHNQNHDTVMDWMMSQGYELESPIFQLFLKPFSNPIVCVLDPRETQDVLLRRSKDFDRSTFFADLFAGSVPDGHIIQPTNDKFRRGRRLLADMMSNGFLHNVAAPRVHKHALSLMELWRVKTNLAAGHAFRVDHDIDHFALDSIWDTALGSQLNSVGQHIELLKSNRKTDVPRSADEAVSFPEPELSENVQAIQVLAHGVDVASASPLPRQAHWFVRQMPSHRRAYARKEQLVQDSLDSARTRLLRKTDGNESESSSEFAEITCATDHMVRREAQAAAREGREPMYNSRSAKDELFGFLVGGFDTTATTIMWMIKFIADHPAVQSKLRDVLTAAFQDTSGVPTAEQITKISIPYLDAVIEEVIRCSETVPLCVRKTVHDTQLLGHHLPKGVDVFFMSNGPGYLAPSDLNDKIPEDARSVSSRENKDRAIPNWDPTDVAKFKPERWLETDSEGRESFDSQAGPTMQFGGGVRGCFGKKMAYLEIRILLIVLLWTYELLPVPEKLSSYAAFDVLTHKPKSCYAVFKEIGKPSAA